MQSPSQPQPPRLFQAQQSAPQPAQAETQLQAPQQSQEAQQQAQPQAQSQAQSEAHQPAQAQVEQQPELPAPQEEQGLKLGESDDDTFDQDVEMSGRISGAPLAALGVTDIAQEEGKQTDNNKTSNDNSNSNSNSNSSSNSISDSDSNSNSGNNIVQQSPLPGTSTTIDLLYPEDLDNQMFGDSENNSKHPSQVLAQQREKDMEDGKLDNGGGRPHANVPKPERPKRADEQPDDKKEKPKPQSSYNLRSRAKSNKGKDDKNNENAMPATSDGKRMKYVDQAYEKGRVRRQALDDQKNKRSKGKRRGPKTNQSRTKSKGPRGGSRKKRGSK